MNLYIFSGNLAKDAEVKTVGENQVANFSVGVNNNKKVNGEWETLTTWVNVTLWRPSEYMANNLAKGAKVIVQGTPSIRSFEAKDGSTKFSFDVNANMVELCTRVERSSEGEHESLAPQADDLPF